MNNRDEPAHAGLLVWDWKEQIDIDHLGRILAALTDGRLHVSEPETHMDSRAIVISTAPLNQEQADEVFDEVWSDDSNADGLTVFYTESDGG